MPKWIGNRFGDTVPVNPGGMAPSAIYNMFDVYYMKQEGGALPYAPFSASGGTKIVNGSDTFFVFTENDDFEVTETGNVASFELLIVGGGGGSGGANDGLGGAGGAGGIQHYTSYPLSTGTFPVVVGDGGAKGADANTAGSQGGDSSFNGYYGAGGGFGPRNLRPTNQARSGNPGGSGGGGQGWEAGGGAGTATQPTKSLASGAGGTNYGNDGASNGGGGGGAGTSGPNGGNGQPFTNFPAPVIAPAIPTSPISTPRPARQDWTEAVGPTGLFGGGGGQSNQGVGWGTPGGFGGPLYGQPGGGGTGSVDGGTGGNAQPGVEYTGGGAAGAYQGASPSGANGGKGIVIVRVTT